VVESSRWFGVVILDLLFCMMGRQLKASQCVRARHLIATSVSMLIKKLCQK